MCWAIHSPTSLNSSTQRLVRSKPRCIGAVPGYAMSESVSADAPAALDEQGRQLLARYIERFNARDFDAVRAMLADEVRLDVINRATYRGAAEVGHYFHNYELVDDWRLALGTVENRPAILVYDPRERSSQPIYFMLLAWDDAQVSHIRDYRYARYVIADAAVAGV
jgi:RNA polymerase sigma-70 factor, ECF subfamily